MKNINRQVTPEQKKALLQGIGERLRILDEHMVSLIKHRIDLSTLVVDIKGDDPIVVLEREKERLNHIGEFAERIGVEGPLAQALLHTIIGAGVKHQTMIRDTLGLNPSRINPGDRDPDSLRRNLLLLTEQVAESYDEHQLCCPATRFTYKKEDQLIRECIESLNHRGTLVDLGTATGRVALSHKAGFQFIKGIDLSENMLNVARSKVSNDKKDRFHFINHDLEEGIPLVDSSVSMVVVNNGTCSDIRNIKFLISEIKRVLVKDGMAYLSFYNAESLVHQSVLPWQNSVAAIFNPVLSTLEVELTGVRGTIPIYGKPFSVSEVRNLLEDSLELMKITTFPFITSILPREILNSKLADSLLDLDLQLCDSSNESGAYVVAIVKKV